MMQALQTLKAEICIDRYFVAAYIFQSPLLHSILREDVMGCLLGWHCTFCVCLADQVGTTAATGNLSTSLVEPVLTP